MQLGEEGSSARRVAVVSIVLAAMLAWLSYRLNRAFGDFLHDEGYLWYGVQRVMAGEVPLRDFMSYELGRYYLTAALLVPFKAHGILALRAGLAVVAAMGIALATGVVGSAWRISRVWQLLPVTALFTLWMVPRHKSFDIAICALLLLCLYRLFRAPCASRYFQLGLSVGAAAVIGQNHGVYGVVATLLAMTLLYYRDRGDVRLEWLVCWAGGVLAGYSPVLLAASFVPGYLDVEKSVLHYLLFEYGGTNLPLPTPWPWISEASSDGTSLSQLTLGLFFLGIPVALVASAAFLLRRLPRDAGPSASLFMAAWALAVPYANVAFSRADAPHLAQAILPFLVLALAAASLAWRLNAGKYLAVAVLLLISLPVAVPLQPRWALHHPPQLEAVPVQGDTVMVDKGAARMLAEAAQVDGLVLALPYYPGLLAALNEKSPIWEIYPLFPRQSSFELAEIARLSSSPITSIMISTAPLDGRKNLAYPMTHPLTYRYIQEHFRRKETGDFELEQYFSGK